MCVWLRVHTTSKDQWMLQESTMNDTNQWMWKEQLIKTSLNDYSYSITNEARNSKQQELLQHLTVNVIES